MEHKKQFWTPFWLRILTAAAITLTAVCIAPLWTRNASGESVANAPVAPSEPSELGVIVTNETSGNIAVFGGGMSGATVPPGRSCLVPFPQGWAWLTVRVVRMNSEGDFFDPESRLYKNSGMGSWHVKCREF